MCLGSGNAQSCMGIPCACVCVHYFEQQAIQDHIILAMDLNLSRSQPFQRDLILTQVDVDITKVGACQIGSLQVSKVMDKVGSPQDSSVNLL